MHNAFARSVRACLKEAVRDARLAGEGLAHIGQASFAVRARARRDFTTCAVETGLAVARDVAPEMALAVTVIEMAEKAADLPPQERSAGVLLADFAQSLTTNAIAAIHAGADLVLDLEESGLEWEARKKAGSSAPAPH